MGKKRADPPDDYDAPLSIKETIGAAIGAVAVIALVVSVLIALSQ